MKPRIYKLWGIWHCQGVAGKTPKDAYANSQAEREVWRFVPGGFVPRVL